MCDLHTELAPTLASLLSYSIPRHPAPSPAQGFEIGSGFSGSRMVGSEHNDEFYMDEHGEVRTRTNRWGKVQGLWSGVFATTYNFTSNNVQC